MNFVLDIRPAADWDVDDIAEFIAADSVRAGERFYEAMGKTFEEVREHPLRWPVCDERFVDARITGVRKRAVIGFSKYLVFYKVSGARVEVLRVLHGARDIRSILR